MTNTHNDIYLAGGCFWGLEEFLGEIEGVVDVEVGYAGGQNENPTYEFHPGHAEAVHVMFSGEYHHETMNKVLDLFFKVHDPTTFNRQGNDRGSSYRSALFYRDEIEKKLFEERIKQENASGFWEDEVVTSVEPLNHFTRAEEYHQHYLQKNLGGYTCHFLRT
jgi:peptide-methionine (S)-S-oxide reductase